MLHPCVVVSGVLLSLAVPTIISMESCEFSGMPGMPGIPGLPGRDGRDGEKGEKGQPGRLWQDKPQKGDQGEPGVMGPSGKRGVVGKPGPKGARGHQGLPGEPGEASHTDATQQSAFSVARGTATMPGRSSLIRFTNVITDFNKDYNTETGHFRCRVQGTYYFVYHASAEEKLCVVLKLENTIVASFCDHVQNHNSRQVSSGGLSVYVRRDQEVWLETGDYRGMTGKPEGYSIFSGFLINAH
ncbi:complement C1q subcomponent subunit C-like [Lampris incognitus]|uniref:complement C1q subcomponent subunit C-like n=1 Tax=Lampris incognitus TaxID=2546036 RepID=UPI0024B4EB9F|nr:complement C1q subcomponent subunit C-like [Lampris incognitus]